MTTAELPLRRPARTAWSIRSRKSSRFGRPGQRVVQRLVLLRDRLAATAVDGEDRQEEQQDRRQREVGGEDDDRREREHQPGGRGLKQQVAREVGEDREALDHRDHRRDDHRVEDEEDDRGEQDADQVARDDVRLVRARETGRGLKDRAGGGDRDRVLQDVERDLLDRLAPDAVREQVGAREADERRERARREHRGEREAGRGRDLALRPAREDLQRDELADEREDREDRDLRREQETKVSRAGDRRGRSHRRRRP